VVVRVTFVAAPNVPPFGEIATVATLSVYTPVVVTLVGTPAFHARAFSVLF
jgi:hypothetical protein